MDVKTEHTKPHTSRIDASLLWVAAFVAAVVQFSAFWLVSGQTEIETWGPVVAVSAIDAAILYLPYPFLHPRWRWLAIVPALLLTIFLITNLWYLRTFLDLMPFSAYLMIDHTGRFVTDGVADAMELSDLWIWLPPLLPVGWWALRRRGIAAGGCYGKRAKWLAVSLVIVAFLSGQFFNLFRNHFREANVGHRFRRNSVTYVERLGTHFTRLACADYYGWPIYFFHELLTSVGAVGRLSDEDVAEVEAFVAQQRIEATDSISQFLARRNRGKNLILIVAESLNSDPVGRRFGSLSVTPHLDSIMATDTAVVVFRKMRPQTRDGRSSDGQLMLNTGLLPLRTEATVYHYGRQDFPSLAKAIGGYAFEVIPEPAIWWNHHWSTRSFGFDSLLCDYIKRQPDYLRVDPLMMADAVEMMKQAPRPFYCQLTTIATHDPYDWYADTLTHITSATLGLDPRLRGYLNTVAISDAQIAQFIADIRAAGLYDDSVIVIAADHNARERCLPDDYPDYTFLMMLNTGIDLRSDRVVGTIDVYPTILHVLGLTDYYWHGLGRSLLAAPPVTAAVDGHGRFYGEATDSVAARLRRAWDISDRIIRNPGLFVAPTRESRPAGLR